MKEYKFPEITRLDQLNEDSFEYSYSDYMKWQFQERVEIIMGKIFPMSAPNTPHQSLAIDIAVGLNLCCAKILEETDMLFTRQSFGHLFGKFHARTQHHDVDVFGGVAENQIAYKAAHYPGRGTGFCGHIGNDIEFGCLQGRMHVAKIGRAAYLCLHAAARKAYGDGIDYAVHLVLPVHAHRESQRRRAGLRCRVCANA